MIKFKITNKEIKEGYKNIITIGYCNIQSLLYFENAIAYNAGVYGWNYDVYQINNNTCICTGYRPVNGMRIDYNIQEKYENKARKILYGDNKYKYETKKRKIQELLNQFVTEVLKENEK